MNLLTIVDGKTNYEVSNKIKSHAHAIYESNNQYYHYLYYSLTFYNLCSDNTYQRTTTMPLFSG